jgi:hypothetical protein
MTWIVFVIVVLTLLAVGLVALAQHFAIDSRDGNDWAWHRRP